jgi:hypothetical protein
VDTLRSLIKLYSKHQVIVDQYDYLSMKSFPLSLVASIAEPHLLYYYTFIPFLLGALTGFRDVHEMFQGGRSRIHQDLSGMAFIISRGLLPAGVYVALVGSHPRRPSLSLNTGYQNDADFMIAL